jgi:hypothetical protein
VNPGVNLVFVQGRRTFTKMFCSKCGCSVAEGDNFFSKCGKGESDNITVCFFNIRYTVRKFIRRRAFAVVARNVECRRIFQVVA